MRCQRAEEETLCLCDNSVIKTSTLTTAFFLGGGVEYGRNLVVTQLRRIKQQFSSSSHPLTQDQGNVMRQIFIPI